MNQELATLPVDQQAKSVLLSNGVKPYLGMLEYLERHENLMTSVTPDNKEDAMLFKKVADEIGGVIKDHRANGKIAREYPNALSKAIIATENEIAEPAEKMKDFFMAGYKAWKATDDERKAAKREAEAREANRVAGIGSLIAEITAIPGAFLNAGASEIASAYEDLNSRDLEAEGSFGEFVEKAKEEKAKALEVLKTAIDRASAHEEQARQFAEMKRQQEEAQAELKAQQEEIARQKADLQRQQQEASQAKLDAERETLAAQRKQQEEEARKLKEEQERLAREAQAKADAEAKEQADKEEAERETLAAQRKQQEEEARKLKEEQERLAREAQAKADAEAKEQADKEEAEREAALRPDKEKIIATLDGMSAWLKGNMPNFDNESSQMLAEWIASQTERLVSIAKQKADEL